jgi:predicted GIY-YIG superfamily endonuclease
VVPSPGGDDGGLWFVYIVECRDGSLYAGITNDLQRREQQHNDGTASRYTRARRPVRLVYAEPHPSRSAALICEFAVKLLSRKDKEALIAARPPPM